MTTFAPSSQSKLKTPDEKFLRPAPSELSHIVGVLARDHAVSVLLSSDPNNPLSYANLETKRIVLHEKDCGSTSEARFTAAHEGAHIGETPSLTALGKTPEQIREYCRKIGFLSLLNVIEDGAVNDRLVARFPRLRDDTLASYPRASASEELGIIGLPEIVALTRLLGHPPRFAQALNGILCDWSELRHELGFGRTLDEYQQQPRLGGHCNDPDVNRFFDRALRQARKAISLIPLPDDDALASFQRGRERFTWCETVLYPELQRLVELDTKELKERIREAVQQQQEQATQGGQSTQSSSGQGGEQQSDQSRNAPGSSSSGQTGISEREAERQALEKLAAVDDEIREMLESFKDKAAPESGSTSQAIRERNQETRRQEEAAQAESEAEATARSLQRALSAHLSPYQREFHEISTMLDPAYARLANVFEPRREYTWRRVVGSGAHIHLGAAMQYDLTGDGYDSIWQTRSKPQSPDQDIVIVLDRSGSMNTNDKFVYARRAVILARELFQRLSIPTACVGFANEPSLFLDFEDDISEPSVQEQLMRSSAPLNEGTKDATAIAFAASLLEARYASRKAIIMLSDAESEEGDELRRIVCNLARDIPVLHFGLGPGTVDKRGNYIHSWGNLPLHGSSDDGFMDVFCREMERLALGALEG